MIGGRILDASAIPITVVDDLTTARARTIGVHGGLTLDAHAQVCARDRGWPLISNDADHYTPTEGIEIDPLPIPTRCWRCQ